MTNKMKWITGGIVGVLALGGIAGVAVASDGGGSEEHGPITGSAYDKASAAALEHTGGGTVTETEIGDEESYYEVEVTMEDGSSVDVQLDQDFRYVSQKVDHESANDDED